MHRALLAIVPLLFAVPAFAGPDFPGVGGYYVSFDDKTDAPRALIEIVEAPDGTLEGYARGSFVPGEDPRATCERCKDELEGQPLLGMRILRELRADDNPLKWKKGRITDPDNGQTYKSKVEFEPDYSSVKVRGYIGTPALGRSQRWVRATPDDIARINATADELGLERIPVMETN